MKTAHEIALENWQHLSDYMFKSNRQKRKQKQVSLAELRETQWSRDFETKMRNRLLIGYYRYGPIGRSLQRAFISRAQKELQNYVASGNLECLVDAANMCLLEYLGSEHPKKHFKSRNRIQKKGIENDASR